MNYIQLKNKEFSFIYLSKKECSVCHALLPKIEKMASGYPKGEFTHIDLDIHPLAAGEFMVFSIPALLVYSGGKELYRGARFFNMMELKNKLDRYYNTIF